MLDVSADLNCKKPLLEYFSYQMGKRDSETNNCEACALTRTGRVIHLSSVASKPGLDQAT
jgi:hypothetical protein